MTTVKQYGILIYIFLCSVLSTSFIFSVINNDKVEDYFLIIGIVTTIGLIATIYKEKNIYFVSIGKLTTFNRYAFWFYIVSTTVVMFMILTYNNVYDVYLLIENLLNVRFTWGIRFGIFVSSIYICISLLLNDYKERKASKAV